MIVKNVSNYLGLDLSVVQQLGRRAPFRYKRYEIRKYDGGKRTIYQPERETKSLQYALMELYLSRLKVHRIAMAYRHGLQSPQLKTAEKHSDYAYSLRVDFKDFFYSIRPKDLLFWFDQNGIQTEGDDAFLGDALFVSDRSKRRRLAIGAPSSPSISNAVLYSLDDTLERKASAIDASSVVTRYADDIVFSTNIKGACNRYLEVVEDTLAETDSPSLRLNESKTSFMSRGNRRVIAGLVICPDGRVTIGRDKKRYVRHLVHEFRCNRLENEEQMHLQGMLAYVLDVEPEFYNRLAHKYGAEVVTQALQSRDAKGEDDQRALSNE